MGLDVIYVHVETNDVLVAYLGAMHTGKFHRRRMRRSLKNVNHVGSGLIYITHAHLFTI